MADVVAALIWGNHAEIAEGVPQKLEHVDIRWITPAEISTCLNSLKGDFSRTPSGSRRPAPV